MKITTRSGAAAVMALAAGTTGAMAGGLGRSDQSVGLIFETGNYVELSISHTNPKVSGTDTATTLGTGNALRSFTQLGAGIKMDINDRWSAALLYDQPWGADTQYPGAVGNVTSSLGGTRAQADSHGLTAIARYKFNDNWSVHGGLRYQQISGDITLSGAAYGAANGYNVAIDRDGSFGWLVGAAYERPEIAMRLAVTYASEIEHEFNTRENIAPGVSSVTRTKTPESFNIDFQTGIAPKTLLLAGFRYADHGVTDLRPTALGADLINLDAARTYTLGVAHRFNDQLVGSLKFTLDDLSGDELVSPLAPVHGSKSISLGLRYDKGNMRLSGGVRYTMLGNAQPATGGSARASFSDNDAITIGARIGYFF